MNYLQQAKASLARQPRTLTNEQSYKLIVCDSWLAELDGIIAHIQAKEPVYKRLSPMWERESGEEFMPDEIWDPKRNDPPPANPGGPFAAV